MSVVPAWRSFWPQAAEATRRRKTAATRKSDRTQWVIASPLAQGVEVRRHIAGFLFGHAELGHGGAGLDGLGGLDPAHQVVGLVGEFPADEGAASPPQQ